MKSKSEKNILIAFILNLGFSIFEFIGGTITNSIAITSDAVHDIGDALSIGLSYFLERKSKKGPDNKYTYGYVRYSLIGSLITTLILLFGSCFVIYSDGDSLNQKSVNLHMLEDVLGWVVVLIGAIIMRFTDIKLLDPILSILVAIFILINAFNNFKSITYLFLEKTPNNISIEDLKNNILKIDGVKDVHHIHIWSIDGYNNCATMHVVGEDYVKLKKLVKEELEKYGICHSTIEIESVDENCDEKNCNPTYQHHD